MKYIRLFLDYLDAIEPLGDAERGRLFTALLQYARTGEAPQLGGNERFLFPMMRAQVDRDEADAAGLSEVRSAAGKKGAQAKVSKTSKSKQNKQMPDLIGKTSKDKDEYKDKDKDYILPPVGGRDARTRVNPPTFVQVLEAAKLRGCPECAKPFFDYYASAGWRDSEGKPVYSWQQKLVAWQMREEKRKKQEGRTSGNVFMDMLREEEDHG